MRTLERADVFAAFPHLCTTVEWRPERCAICRWVLARYQREVARWAAEQAKTGTSDERERTRS